MPINPPNIDARNPQQALTDIREFLRRFALEFNQQQNQIQRVNKEITDFKLESKNRPEFTFPVQALGIPQEIKQSQPLTGDVTGLLGLLSQPQHPYVPIYENSTPSTNDPNIQDGTLFVDESTNHLYLVDGRVEPLTFIDLTLAAMTGAFAVGTFAAIPAPSAMNENTLYFATDRQWLYYSDGSDWLYIAGVFIGTRANRVGLSMSADETNALAFETDSTWSYRYTGSAWAYQNGVFKGTRATRTGLTIGADDNGAMFYETDYNLFWMVESGAWVGMPLGCLNVNITQVSVNAASTADQNLMVYQIPAGLLNVVGRTIRVSCRGNLDEDAGSGAVTIRFKVKLGGVTVLDWTPNTPNVSRTNLPWHIEGLITCATTGATADVEAHGTCGVDDNSSSGSVTSDIGDHNTAVVGGVDLTVNADLQVTVSFSTSLATNVGRQRQMVVEILN